MMPEDGKYKLTKCFSRLALRDFPQNPTYAGECGAPLPRAAATAADTAEKAVVLIPQPAIPVMAPVSAPALELTAGAEPGAAGEAEPEAEEEIYVWQRQTGGALTCLKDGTRFLALPYNTPRLPVERIRDTREIEGTKYAIFKIEDGKIL
jgi:hypothetical protein